MTDARGSAVTRGLLMESVPGAVLADPADDVTLAVAESLLGTSLPPELAALLRVADGIRCPGLELFGAERIAEETTASPDAWLLRGWLLIGTAGPGRSLSMHSARAEVNEGDTDPWDVTSLQVIADDPASLFLRHHGVPVGHRPADWALPGVAAAVTRAVATAQSYAEGLGSLRVHAGSRSGTGVVDGVPVRWTQDQRLARSLLQSAGSEGALLNAWPPCPVPGPTAKTAFDRAVNELGARVTEAVRPHLDSLELPEQLADPEVADTARFVVRATVLAAARESLAEDLVGHALPHGLGRRLLAVLSAGHLPLSYEESTGTVSAY